MSNNNPIHPCFNKHFAGKIARVHLPLIKKCNIQCNYCNRSYNCPNENRPGVTSRLIKPEEVCRILKDSLKTYPDLKIVGIAGPGEALAEPEILYESFSLVRKYFPDLKLCLSTNGYAVVDCLEIIDELKIDYITVTVNTVDPETALKIYSVDNIDNLISRQSRGIEELLQLNTIVKINSVLIPGINEKDIADVAKTFGAIKVFAQNIIPFCPVKGSPFENINEPQKEEVEKIRFECSKYIKQIAHCRRCRADVAGNLYNDTVLMV